MFNEVSEKGISGRGGITYDMELLKASHMAMKWFDLVSHMIVEDFLMKPKCGSPTYHMVCLKVCVELFSI